jgi:hypothetical protein
MRGYCGLPGWVTRSFGLVLILLGVAGLLLCAAGVVAAWRAQARLAPVAGQLSDRAEKTLDLTEQGLARVTAMLTKARSDLRTFEQAPAGGSPPSPDGFMEQAAFRYLAQDLGNRFGNARQSIDAVTMAAVVANSLLESLEEIPLAEFGRLDKDQLEQVSQHLQSLVVGAQKLNAALGAKGGAADARQVSAEMEDSLTKVIDRLEGLKALAAAYKVRVAELSSSVSFWIHWGPLLVTGVLIWVALGQLSLILHGRAWWRAGGRPS